MQFGRHPKGRHKGEIRNAVPNRSHANQARMAHDTSPRKPLWLKRLRECKIPPTKSLGGTGTMTRVSCPKCKADVSGSRGWIIWTLVILFFPSGLLLLLLKPTCTCTGCGFRFKAGEREKAPNDTATLTPRKTAEVRLPPSSGDTSNGDATEGFPIAALKKQQHPDRWNVIISLICVLIVVSLLTLFIWFLPFLLHLLYLVFLFFLFVVVILFFVFLLLFPFIAAWQVLSGQVDKWDKEREDKAKSEGRPPW